MSDPHASAFEALGDPTRRAILRELRSGPKAAGQIAEAFDLSKPTLSHHFKVLREAGLVRAERSGTSIVYTLQANALEELAVEILDWAESRERKARARKAAT
ncbi:MAG: metalloregulator ArsR/SmtB family transcription factor [Byssovorax sp.]